MPAAKESLAAETAVEGGPAATAGPRASPAFPRASPTDTRASPAFPRASPTGPRASPVGPRASPAGLKASPAENAVTLNGPVLPASSSPAAAATGTFDVVDETDKVRERVISGADVPHSESRHEREARGTSAISDPQKFGQNGSSKQQGAHEAARGEREDVQTPVTQAARTSREQDSRRKVDDVNAAQRLEIKGKVSHSKAALKRLAKKAVARSRAAAVGLSSAVTRNSDLGDEQKKQLIVANDRKVSGLSLDLLQTSKGNSRGMDDEGRIPILHTDNAQQRQAGNISLDCLAYEDKIGLSSGQTMTAVSEGGPQSSSGSKPGAGKTRNGKPEAASREVSAKKSSTGLSKSPKAERSPWRFRKEESKTTPPEKSEERGPRPDSRPSTRSGLARKDRVASDQQVEGPNAASGKQSPHIEAFNLSKLGRMKLRSNGQILAGQDDANNNVQSDAALSEGEQAELQNKAQALLSQAVMRKVANMVSTDGAGKGRTSASEAADPLSSSLGAKSLNSSGGSRSLSEAQGRPAHKTQSMQSLSVPLAGLGATPTVPEDRAGESAAAEGDTFSRRDSIRHSGGSSSRKSVDYRFQQQLAQAVAPPSGGEEKAKPLMHDDSLIRAAIPYLPLPLAVLCFVLNLLLPGSGTVLSGLSVLCCGRPRVSSKGDALVTTLCVNLFVGLAQLSTVTFLLVGWFWSLAWGVKMVILAVENRAEQKQQREKELQTLALRAFGSPGNGPRRTVLPPV